MSPTRQYFVDSRGGHRRRGLPASDNDSERLLPHCDDVRGPPQRRRRRRQDGLPWANEFCPSLTRQAFFSFPDPLRTGWWHGCSGAGRPLTSVVARQPRFTEQEHPPSPNPTLPPLRPPSATSPLP